MRRQLTFSLLTLLLVALPGPALTIIYIDPETKKEIEVRAADTDEGPDGITIKKGQPFEVTYTKVAMRTQRNTKLTKLTFPLKVAPGQVKDYQLQEDDLKPAITFLDFRPPMASYDRAMLSDKEAERLKLLKDSIPLFKQIVPKLPAGSKARRHTEYRMAESLYLISLIEEAGRDDAIKALEAYSQANAGSWHISLALTFLARLQEDKGDLAAVQKTYESLAGLPGLSQEQKTDSQINVARTLMKSEKFTDARGKLQALQGTLPADSPLKSKVQVYLAQCQILSDNATEAQQAETQLKILLTGTDDKALKALAHNTLGDYYTKLKKDEDAFWQYLRVDTLYSEDRHEHSRALFHLARLFREVKKDADRADSYLEMLTKDPRFTGLEYQKKALKK